MSLPSTYDGYSGPLVIQQPIEGRCPRCDAYLTPVDDSDWSCLRCGYRVGLPREPVTWQ